MSEEVFNDNTDVNSEEGSFDNLILCYVTCPQDSSKSFVGGVLITDFKTRPLHFAYVTPVRPTALQKILYGSTLNEHVQVDVIAKKLFQEIPVVPTVLFVDSEDVLKIQRIVEYPVAYLSKANESVSDGSTLSTLRYKTYTENYETQKIIGQTIANLENAIDLIEPFHRMREALKEALKNIPDK